jgi:hypothetical protein
MTEQSAEQDSMAMLAETTVEVPVKGETVSDQDFEDVVRGTLDAVGGTLLFKLRVDEDEHPHHAAAAFVGDSENRQFLVLTMPTAGGQLRVETAADSASPIARIAAAYAGLADAFSTAA